MKAKQSELILNYMKRYGSINPMEAMRDIGCMRLAARIADLKAEGHKITSTIVEGCNRFGETVHFSEYSLESEVNA